MKKILRKYPETVLAILAIVFLGVILAYFSWGIGEMVVEVDRAVNVTPEVSGGVGFDLRGAQALNLKGLVKPQ